MQTHCFYLTLSKNKKNKAWLNTDMPEFTSAVEKIKAGKSSISALRNYFKISKQVEQKIIDAVSQ